jgi:predicted hotdog family 3-hydroxylacyl-ACP dehydratase
VKGLPHTGVARFLVAVLESGEEKAVCLARVPDGSPFVTEGRVPSFVLLDVAAQAAAAVGAAAPDSSASKAAYLVGAKNVLLAPGGFRAGADLTVTVRRETGSGPLTVARASVTEGDRELFSGVLSLFTET